MKTSDDGSIPVCVYRLLAGPTKTDWQVVARLELAQRDCEYMNAQDPNGDWKLELLAAKIPIHQVRPLIGYLCGSQTGGHKAEVARLNGKRGGRPRKPIDVFLPSENPSLPTQNNKEVLEANLPPL